MFLYFDRNFEYAKICQLPLQCCADMNKLTYILSQGIMNWVYK